jgi:hypothetical protein
MRMRWLILVVLAAAIAVAGWYLLRPAWNIRTASTNLEVIGLDAAELAARGIRLVDMGKLDLPSGRIVAADPLTQPDRPALAQVVEPGRYEVSLYVAEGRVALAVLELSRAPVETWELALLTGQDMADLPLDSYFGFPVDTGLGAYMDATTLALIEERERRVRREIGPQMNYYNDVLHAELRDAGDLHLMHRPLPDREQAVAIFGSGWGDGVYPSIWGLDEIGAPSVLVTDFHVLDNGHVPEHEVTGD